MKIINKIKQRLLRLFLVCLTAVLIMGAAACAKIDGSPQSDPAEDKDGKLQILCTVFPIYDWAKNIAGDSENVEVSLLLTKGTDIHSYQPTVSDGVRIADADLVIRIGGSSDSWIADAAEGKTPLLTLSEADGITLCESEGHEDGEEHVHEHRHGEHEDSHHHEFDEHIWLSLKNAIVCSKTIAESLSSLDKINAEKYNANLKDYTKNLQALNDKYSLAAEGFGEKRLIFADRFPFIYLFSQYNIHYHAAFSGCSTDVEASFDVIIKLAEAMREEGAEYILVTESSDKRIAETVLSESYPAGESIAPQVLVLDSLQSVTPAKIDSGYSYIGAMEENLRVLQIALKP